jgi:PII-like signaling protein
MRCYELYKAIIELLRGRQYAGATVLRAITGFGASARLRTDRIEVLSLDLPIVIEVVETEEKIQACTRHHVPPGTVARGTHR